MALCVTQGNELTGIFLAQRVVQAASNFEPAVVVVHPFHVNYETQLYRSFMTSAADGGELR